MLGEPQVKGTVEKQSIDPLFSNKRQCHCGKLSWVGAMGSEHDGHTQ